MTDSVGPEKLVCHMQGCMLLHWGPHLIYIYKSQNSKRICLAGLLLYMYVSATNYQTVRTECCLAKRNSGISRLQDMCLSDIHNANYIVNSIVCAVILVRRSRVPAYGIQPMHDPIHILDMHGTGNKHIVHHSQKSVVQWSGVAELNCIYIYIHFHRTA